MCIVHEERVTAATLPLPPLDLRTHARLRRHSKRRSVTFIPCRSVVTGAGLPHAYSAPALMPDKTMTPHTRVKGEKGEGAAS